MNVHAYMYLKCFHTFLKFVLDLKEIEDKAIADQMMRKSTQFTIMVGYYFVIFPKHDYTLVWVVDKLIKMAAV